MTFSIVLLVAAATAVPDRVDLFVPTPRFPCFRQPAIAAIAVAGKPRTLLAFAENRNVSACAPALGSKEGALQDRRPFEIGSMNLRRSTDGGKSWGPIQTLYSGSLDFYVVAPDDTTGHTHLFIAAEGLTVLTSTDAGASWSEGKQLSVDVPAPFKITTPSVGHGITISAAMCAGGCAQAGRLVVPLVCSNSTGPHGHGDKGVCMGCTS
eukprot:gene4566-19471_t